MPLELACPPGWNLGEAVPVLLPAGLEEQQDGREAVPFA